MMRNKTKEITLTALLTALAIVIPMIMPIKVVMPPFTATLASHTPLIIAMFVSPLAAAFAAIGSAIGFFFTFSPIVAARAATHIFFTVAGAMMIQKRSNPILTVIVTLILHSLADMATVYLAAEFFRMGSLIGTNTMGYVQAWLGLGTAVHHLVDFVLAYLVLLPLAKAKLINPKLLERGKNRETVSSNQ